MDASHVLTLPNTYGRALKWADTNKSLYVELRIDADGWYVVRKQIRRAEELYGELEGETVAQLNGLCYRSEQRQSSAGDIMCEVTIRPSESDTESLLQAILRIAHR